MVLAKRLPPACSADKYAVGFRLLMLRQRNGDNTDVFELALKLLEKSFRQWPDTDLHLSSIGI